MRQNHFYPTWLSPQDGTGRTLTFIPQEHRAHVSGRFAMIEDGMGFSLAPWRLMVEQRLAQYVAFVVRGQFVTWKFGRQRGIGI
ncbi:DUF3363 domain-containing protein [Thermomonas sp.]|uniref:DUF3363 domain-containing protein n=1 Tax=Thermomonas sp. TaxID=1971895 RepID=UPI00248A7E0B|nr:DUF3363 domain-containing protein [Thermomonas sp.]MDI1251591.1 DUF3363 domain-containing protein [Thermomonas sp.]